MDLDDGNKRGEQPIEMDRTPVPMRGEPLTKILWRGRQWAVTAHGVECLDGTYHFDASRLLEDLDRGWGWPQQVCQKTWVDTDDFLTAWLVAIALHGAAGDPDKIRAAIAASTLRQAT